MARANTKKAGAQGVKREGRHSGNNGKKEGLSGSSFFTWFMVIALLGVWTSVAVVWFDLVDYEDVLAKAKDFHYNLSEVLQGKLDAYDTDGDGDFDIEDAKVLLGLKDRVVAKKGSEESERDSQATSDDISDLDLEDLVNDESESDSPYEDISDLEEALDDHEALQAEHDEVSEFNLEDAVDPSVPKSVNVEPDEVSDFNLEDAVEPSVHQTLNAEPEDEDEPEEELVTEEQANIKKEEIETDEQDFTENKVEDVYQETATFEDNVEDLPLNHEDEVEAEEQEPYVEEQEVEADPVVEESKIEFETPYSEADDEPDLEEELQVEEVATEPLAAVKVDEIPEPVHEEITESEGVEAADEAEPEPQDEYEDSQNEAEVADNKYEHPEETVEIEVEELYQEEEEDVLPFQENEPTETEEDESAEFLAAVPEGKAVLEQVEEVVAETLEQNTATHEDHDDHEDHADT